MRTKRIRGWAVLRDVQMRSDKFINVDIVCSCSRHEKCAARGQCQWVKAESEEIESRMLRRAMGDKFPKEWGRRLMWRNLTQYRLRSEAFERLKKDTFKRCKSLVVEVKPRKT